jgi:hypothetical protein
VIFAPRALSMMSSAVAELPVRLAGPGGSARRRIGAHLAVDRLLARQLLAPDPMVTFASSPPTGMSRSGGFGMRKQEVLERRLRRGQLRVEVLDPLAGGRRGRLGARRPPAPSGAAPPLIASPMRFEASFRSAFSPSLSPRSRRRSASTSSARSTSAGSSPLRTAPSRIRSGSSRSRCSPTLTTPLRLRPRRQPRSIAAATKSLSSDASSQPARGPLSRPRNAT